HLTSGVVSLYFGLAGSAAAARAFCFTFGAVYALLGVAGMAFGVPGTPTMAGMPPDPRLLRVLPGRLALGTTDHAGHVVIARAYLVAVFLTHPAGISHRGTHAAPLTP